MYNKKSPCNIKPNKKKETWHSRICCKVDAGYNNNNMPCTVTEPLLGLYSQSEIFLTFQFSSIRKCGAHEHFFLMEVGRSAVTGSGDIWLEVEGSHAAQNMHDVILS